MSHSSEENERLRGALAGAERALLAAEERLRELTIDLDRCQSHGRELIHQNDRLLEGMQVLVESTQVDTLYAGMLRVLRTLLEFEDAFILVAGSDGVLRPVASTASQYSATAFVVGAYFGRVTGGETLAASDTGQITEWQAQPADVLAGAVSALHLPLRTSDPAAVLVCVRALRGFFNRPRVRQAKRFAVLARQALQNVEQTERLRMAQRELVESAKLTALGNLVAGIAHEIKNPLNFVNNFAELSLEFADELDRQLPELAGVPAARHVGELLAEVSGNLRLIRDHGRRADAIVEGMLLHARERPGQLVVADLNALVTTHVALAYQGFRAGDRGFVADIVEDLGSDLDGVPLAYQELSRVVVNLVSNACHALRERARRGEPDYRPMILVTTRREDEGATIRVRDHGTGIPAELRRRIFDPFFTTKPPGEGTGLGLSITFDIVVAQLGGKLDVASVPGEYAEFTLWIPLRDSAPAVRP